MLLALNDASRPGYAPAIAQDFAALGASVFACTPDLFPDLTATALSRRDVGSWAAQNNIATVRGEAAGNGCSEAEAEGRCFDPKLAVQRTEAQFLTRS